MVLSFSWNSYAESFRYDRYFPLDMRSGRLGTIDFEHPYKDDEVKIETVKRQETGEITKMCTESYLTMPAVEDSSKTILFEQCDAFDKNQNKQIVFRPTYFRTQESGARRFRFHNGRIPDESKNTKAVQTEAGVQVECRECQSQKQTLEDQAKMGRELAERARANNGESLSTLDQFFKSACVAPEAQKDNDKMCSPSNFEDYFGDASAKPPKIGFKKYLETAARVFGIPYKSVACLAWQESKWNMGAGDEAKGLMQITGPALRAINLKLAEPPEEVNRADLQKWKDYFLKLNIDESKIPRKLEAKDRTSPETAIAMGAFYYSTIALPNIPKKVSQNTRENLRYIWAAAAYNAGPIAPGGRVKGETDTEYILRMVKTKYDIMEQDVESAYNAFVEKYLNGRSESSLKGWEKKELEQKRIGLERAYKECQNIKSRAKDKTASCGTLKGQEVSVHIDKIGKCLEIADGKAKK